MRPAYTVEQVRTAERAVMAGLPPGTLMQRAATAVARRCADVLDGCYGRRIVLLVGKGDNGGDALFAGARLARRGARVDALPTGDDLHPAGAAGLRRAGGTVHPPDADAAVLLAAADLVVDGVLGIGGRGGLRDRAAELATLLESAPAVVLAVDVPSGVDATSGRVDGVAIRADVTVTFGALKTGLVVSPGAQYAGVVDCVDIGLDDRLADPAALLLDADDVADLLPVPAGETTKYGRGVLGVVAGSDTYPGAAVLAVAGAIAAGAGMVRFAGVEPAAEQVRRAHPEAIVTVVPHGRHGTVADAAAVLAAGRVQAWVVGSGLGTDDDARAVVHALLDTDVPVLLDADAVTLLAADHPRLQRRSAPTLLTPHAGEFARLVGADRADVEADRLAHATRAAADLGVTVLLKGSVTVVAPPRGSALICAAGTGWLATAGSGDVLSGGCGALLAAGLSAADAGAAGAFLHGLAGRLAAGRPGAPIAARDIATHWPAAVRAVRRAG